MATHSIKAVFVGPSGAGKSAIIRYFSGVEFISDSNATVGIDFMVKHLKLEDGTEVQLKIWDTAGQERFHALSDAYTRDASVAVIVFDITDPRAHEHLTYWLKYVGERRGEDTRILLVGNKIDLFAKRRPSNAPLKRLTANLGVPYLETSAKTGLNLDELLEILSRMPFEEGKRKTSEIIQLNSRAQKTFKERINECGC